MVLRYATLSLLSLLITPAFAWNTPVHSSPTNGGQTWVGITLNWLPVSASQAYQLQVDTSSNFNSPLLFAATQAYINSTDGNSDTQRTFSGLRFGTTYHWRVRAYVAGDTSAWSIPWYFLTRDIVNLTSPASGSETWTGLNLDWAVHPGVTFYDAQVDTSSVFNSNALREVSNAYINSTDGNGDTRWSLSDLYFGTNYQWRVRARSGSDTSAWSEARTFHTQDYVTLSSPADGILRWTGLTLDWAVHTGVDFYDAQADTSANFDSPALRQVSNTYVNGTEGNGDTQWYLNHLFFGKNYHWRVRARNGVDTCTWSPSRSFVTNDGVTLTSPDDLTLFTNVNGTTLNWAPHTGITTYQLQWDTTNLFSSGLLQAVSKPYINSTDGNSDTQHSSGALLPNQWYLWRVRAINAVDTSAWTLRRFSTGTTLPNFPSTPTLISPPNGSIVTTALTELEWSMAANATTYQYLFSTLPDLTNAQPVTVQTTAVPVGPLDVGTTYYWSIRGVNGIGVSAWSSIWNFTFDPSTSVEGSTTSDLIIFPNPSTNQITISLLNGTLERLILCDAEGRMIRNKRVTGPTEQLDLSDLPTGNYLLQLHTTEGILVRPVVRAH